MEEYKHKLENIIRADFDLTERSADGIFEALQLVEDIAISFGGCSVCWGAGYIQGDKGWAFKPCVCDRGKRLRDVAAALDLPSA
jgi:hypothetical protein